MKKKNIVIFPIFFIVYILPTFWFKSYNIAIDNIVFIIYFCLFISLYYAKKLKINCIDLIFIAFVILITISQKHISHLHLLSLIILDKMIVDKDQIYLFLKDNRYMYILSIIFTIIYSFIYFGHMNRFLYTGIREPNESSLALFILFMMIRYSNKKLGTILLFIGLLTFSKSYLLSVLLFFSVDRIVKNKKLKKIDWYKYCDFKKMIIFSSLILICLSIFFSNLYNQNKLREYADSGIARFTLLTDTSNYYRFTVNTNLLLILKDNPKYLLTGIDTNEFYAENLRVARNLNQEYRKIRPHNYVFSYLQIYGIFSIFIFFYVSKILKRVVNNNSFPMYIAIFSYTVFLGMGLTSYWLFLSIFAITIYMRPKEELNG